MKRVTSVGLLCFAVLGCAAVAHAAALRPVPMPEPATLSLLGVGLGAFAIWKTRRK